MLQIFKTNQILASVLFLIYLGLFYSVNFLVEQPLPSATPGIFGQMIREAVGGWPQSSLRISAFVMVFLQAVVLVVLVNSNRINSESNLLPGVFFCLFAGMVPEFMYPSAPLLANFFLLFALMELMGIYKIPVVSGRLFNVGFWISVASLFYFSTIGLLLFAFWGTSNLRAYNFRDAATIFFGAFTPYFLTATMFFLLDRFPEFIDIQFAKNLTFWDFQPDENSLFYLKAGIFGLLVIMALLSGTGFYQKRIMQVQKKISLLYGFLIFSGLIAMFQMQADISHLLIACIPLAVFFSMSFSSMPAQWAEVVHLLMLVAGMALAYSPWLFAPR